MASVRRCSAVGGTIIYRSQVEIPKLPMAEFERKAGEFLLDDAGKMADEFAREDGQGRRSLSNAKNLIFTD